MFLKVEFVELKEFVLDKRVEYARESFEDTGFCAKLSFQLLCIWSRSITSHH